MRTIMILAIDNAESQQLLDMDMSLSALEEAYKDLGTGAAITSPRIDLLTPDSYVDEDGNTLPGAHSLKTMSASTQKYAAIRFLTDKLFWHERGGNFRRDRTPGTQRAHSVTRGLLFLFSLETGDLLALISEGHIRNLRVGAAAGLAARYLAKPDASSVAVLGTGFMAGAHLDAMLNAVEGVKSVRVFSPNPEHRERFVEDPRWERCPDVAAAGSAEEAVRGSEIVIIATNALTPVIRTGWLEPGQYVCSVRHCEIAPETFGRFDVLAVNSRDNLGPTTFVAKNAHGPLPKQVLLDIEKGYPPGDAVEIDWAHTPDLPDLLLGRHPGRANAEQITCFNNSVGFGLQFAALAGKVYEAAVRQGVGRQVPDDVFPDLF
ncbi:MAG: ornithine cyclodeaminase family protein [Deltaproteobacteria bacterium]|nr:ornithine cyclodeaminase family protein [Deltaproteobacteria bacterium]